MKLMNYEEIAKLCHQVNKAYCTSMGDTSQVNWDDAPTDQQRSASNGVEFHMINHNTTPRDSHNSWMLEKKNAGWKFGPIKNVDLKTHPCMVPYESLPMQQRSKDFIFKAICDFFKKEFFGSGGGKA